MAIDLFGAFEDIVVRSIWLPVGKLVGHDGLNGWATVIHQLRDRIIR